MKTPKDILLQQHAEATAALDRIRGRVVAELKQPVHSGFWSEAWTHLFWQPRRIWCSLATAWVVMLVIDASTGASPERSSAQRSAPDKPIVERHHNVLRAELGIPEKQRAEKPKRKTRQSHHAKHSYA